MEGKQAPPSEEVGGLKLCELGQLYVVPAGTRIVTQGETPEFFYIIQSGRLQAFRETADHIRTPLMELGPGAYFGEVALVTAQPRTASVESLEESSLIKVSKEEFDRLLDHNPQLARHTRAAATLIAAMNLIFIVGLVHAIYLHLPINCGCVGEVGEPVTWWKVLKNTGMLVMTIQIFLYDRFLVLDRGGFIWRDSQI